MTTRKGPRKGRLPDVEQVRAMDDAALLVLEWLAERGVGAALRVDADRWAEGRPAWTFTASGGPLDGAVRADGPTAAACLARAVERLRELGLDVPA